MSESKAGTSAPSLQAARAPALIRRMAAFTYEGVLLFGVLFSLVLAHFAITRQNVPAQTHAPLMAISFLGLAAYFIFFWTRTGQTLALRTWDLRVVTRQGQPLTLARALARHLAAYLWFLPPLLLLGALGVPLTFGIFWEALLGWIALYALSTFVSPRRQFWHDLLCDTAIVHQPRRRPLPE